MEQPYSPNLSDLAECVILCTSWLPSPGKVYCRTVNIWVTLLVELRGPILSAQAGHQLSIYCIKELFGRNSPHLASVNSAYKIWEIVVRCLPKIDVRPLQAFFVIPLLSHLWEEKNYCERRNELSSWRPVALPNRHIHLYLFKLGYDVHALLSSVMYILSGENSTVLPCSQYHDVGEIRTPHR